jgi:hypothetical protein
MVEQVQFVNILEIASVRITCPDCKSMTESELHNVGLAFKGNNCRVCGAMVCYTEDLLALANAIDTLKKASANLKSAICFPLRPSA